MPIALLFATEPKGKPKYSPLIIFKYCCRTWTRVVQNLLFMRFRGYANMIESGNSISANIFNDFLNFIIIVVGFVDR